MSRRIRRKENTEQEIEEQISAEEALNANVEVSIYDKFADIVTQYGNNLLLRIYTIKSDSRSLGFVDEVVGEEIDLFLQAPESFLRDRFGPGTFRITVVNGGTKKFITNLTISISSPKNLTPNPNTDYLGEVSKAYKEGLNLGKSSSQPNNQFPFDLTKLVELVMIQQEKAREREEKTLERIRNEENRLREKELQLLEKVYSNNMEASKQFQPVVEFMSQSGKVLTSAMTMLERSANFMHTFSPENTDRPFWERILVGIGEKFVNSNPQILDKLISIVPQMGLSKAPNTPPFTANIPLGNNPPTETKTPKEESSLQDTSKAQFDFDFAFPMILLKYMKRASRNEDPSFSADSFMSDMEDLVSEKLVSENQLNQAYNLIISENLDPYIRNFYPDVVKFKAWLIDFQNAIKENLTAPQEEKPEDTR